MSIKMDGPFGSVEIGDGGDAPDSTWFSSKPTSDAETALHGSRVSNVQPNTVTPTQHNVALANRISSLESENARLREAVRWAAERLRMGGDDEQADEAMRRAGMEEGR